MKDKLIIKQILPIPNGCTVLTPIEGTAGKVEMVDLTREGWSYVIALVDGGEWDDDYISLYEIDTNGDGELCNSARIVPIRTCLRCGQEMTPYWDVNLPIPVWYSCECSPGGGSNL